jgi:hypothetical protein
MPIRRAKTGERRVDVRSHADRRGGRHSLHGKPRWSLRGQFEGVADDADVLLLAGDLTNTGQPGEVQALVDELAAVRVGRASRSHRSSESIRSRVAETLHTAVFPTVGTHILGRKRFEGPAAEIAVNPQVRQLYLGQTQAS